jgi:hypothetical protein
MVANEGRIEAIIQQLEALASEEEGYFSMWQSGGGPDESIIQANKDGLRLYAIELLKASLEKECKIGQDEVVWLPDDASVWIMNIELIGKSREQWRLKPTHPEPEEGDFSSKLLMTGCASIGVLLLAIFVIGLETLFKWFF